MRTTVTIEDELLKQVRKEALERGMTLGHFIEEALRDRLAQRRANRDAPPLRLVTAGGSGPRDGIELADNAAVRDVMDGLG